MIAVLGASGQVGSAFARHFGVACLPVTRDMLDLSDIDAIAPWIASNRPDMVINCAAYTAVDAAESDPTTARRVNSAAVEALARACGSNGIGFVTFSTDYVFDGTKETAYVETDVPNPLNVYGQSKAEGERLALALYPSSLVIRTSWVLSATHRSFASTMIDLISDGPVRVVDDQRGHPTLVDDLVISVSEAITAGAAGILHITNAGETTWFALAREIADMAGLDAQRVTPCRSEELPRPAQRPRNSLLASERFRELGLAALPHYRPSLERIVRELAESQRPRISG